MSCKKCKSKEKRSLFQKLLSLKEQIVTLSILEPFENREEMTERLLTEKDKLNKGASQVVEAFRNHNASKEI